MVIDFLEVQTDADSLGLLSALKDFKFVFGLELLLCKMSNSKSKCQYAVVVFTTNDEMDVVPYNWLYSEDESTYS